MPRFWRFHFGKGRFGRFYFSFSKNGLRGAFGSVCTASGGGRTLRSHDLGIILALHRDGVSDGEHSVDVIKKWRKGFC
jgi:hypothetical protein